MPICAYIRRNGQLSKCGPRESFCLFTSTQWKNFHSLFLRDARPGARFNQQPHCCIVCLLWRGAGRGGAGRMYAAPSRFYIGARNGNWQHELVVSCRSSPRPRRAGSIFPRAASPEQPLLFARNQSLAFCVAQPGGAASKDIRGSL